MVDALTKGLPGVPAPESIDPALRAILPHDAIYPPDEELAFAVPRHSSTSSSMSPTFGAT